MEKKLIAKLDPCRDFVSDFTENTNYIITLETFDDMGSFGYFANRVNRGFSTSMNCMLYNRKQCVYELGYIEFDEYDEEIRVYVKR